MKKHLLFKVLFLILSACSINVIAQTTTIINPANNTGTSGVDGSFESASPAGWTIVNGSTNKWFMGTQSFCTGTKGAYVGTALGNNNYTMGTADISHFYKTVTFPAGQTCITLTFNFKSGGESVFDGLKIYLGSNLVAPLANIDYTTTDATAAQIGNTWYNLQAACGAISITIPASYAGTTKNIVFSWKNDNSGGANPGTTVDDVSLVSVTPVAPSCATLNTPANNAINQTKCNPTISWTAPAIVGCNAPAQYYVYFGTSTNPPLFDSTTSTSYQLWILNSSTKYFWRIIPKNSSGLATGCVTEFNFTTDATACTVSPGGAGTANLTAWFKSDALAAGNVTSWTTVFPTGGSAITLNDPATPYSQSTNGNLAATNYFNYNQYVSFSGNTLATQTVLYTETSYNLMTNSNNVADQSSFFNIYQRGSISTDGVIYWRPSAGNYGLQFRGYGRLAIGSGIGNSINSARDWSTLVEQTLISYTGNRSSSSSMTAQKNAVTFPTAGSSEATGSTGISMGARIGTAGPNLVEFFDGNSAESIFFNSTLSTTLANRVHTYLAIKFGITLATNYYASNYSTIYALTGAYTNNIIGIGRDDISALLQKQSHNVDDTVRIYKGTLSTTNLANGASFAADQSYVVAGANTGKLCNTAASNAEKPAACGLYSRLEREWKVTNTNFVETFNMDIKLNACGAPGSVNVADLRFIVDDDGNFGAGTTTCYFNGDGTGIVISYANPVITVKGIANVHIANNATKFITIGSVNKLTPLPIELLSFVAKCSNQNITLNWSTATETNNNYFEVQRSNDAVYFMSIAQVAGHGNSTQLQQYQYVDGNAPSGNVYYRLKEVDNDLSVHYHPIISVTNDCSDAINNQGNINVYPNPNNGNVLQLGYMVKKDEDVEVKFYDVLGQITSTQKIKLNVGTSETSLQIGNLAKGVYFIQIESTQLNNKPVKLIKE